MKSLRSRRKCLAALLLGVVGTVAVFWYRGLQWQVREGATYRAADYVHLDHAVELNLRNSSSHAETTPATARYDLNPISSVTLPEAIKQTLQKEQKPEFMFTRKKLDLINESERSQALSIEPVTSHSSSAPTVGLASTVENGLLSDEIDAIFNRIDTCLISTNMSAHFKQAGYYDRARHNARVLWTALREVVPKFSGSYQLPCWSTSFSVDRTWETRLGPRSNSILGHIGEYEFYYNDHEYKHRLILDRVPWKYKKNFQASLVCFPKTFVLGYPKCGSTFLYCLLNKILQLSMHSFGSCQAYKEPHWWIVPGPRKKVMVPTTDNIALYLLNFVKGANYVERSLPAMTIEASPNLMFQWPRYAEEETMQNYCLLPAVIPTLLPDSKYIVIMRNPISMLYSAFWFSCTSFGFTLGGVKHKGPDIFHKRITEKIDKFNKCRQEVHPLDKCVDVVADNLYTPELPSCGRTRLEMGLYYVHTRKWLSIVPRERFLFLTLEELIKNDMKTTATTLLDFLELDSTVLNRHSTLDIECVENTQKTVDYKHDPKLMMREDTRQILVQFFRPYNQMLADLLGDDKFLWNES